MSWRSMRITAPLTIWPSVPLTSPSIAAICAHEAPAKSVKQKPPKMYPRNRASISFSSPGVKLSIPAYYDVCPLGYGPSIVYPKSGLARQEKTNKRIGDWQVIMFMLGEYHKAAGPLERAFS